MNAIRRMLPSILLVGSLSASVPAVAAPALHQMTAPARFGTILPDRYQPLAGLSRTQAPEATTRRPVGSSRQSSRREMAHPATTWAVRWR